MNSKEDRAKTSKARNMIRAEKENKKTKKPKNPLSYYAKIIRERERELKK